MINAGSLHLECEIMHASGLVVGNVFTMIKLCDNQQVTTVMVARSDSSPRRRERGVRSYLPGGAHTCVYPV